MSKHVTVETLGDDLLGLLGRVKEGDEPVIIDEDGAAVAVLISPEQYQRYHEQVDGRFREAVAELRQRNIDKDPDDVLRDVTAAVEEVRRQRHERKNAGE